MVCFLEKARYKWRRRKTLVRFVVLRRDDIWNNWSPPQLETIPQAKEVKRRKPRRDDGRQPRQVA
jgi:hypothetical protein